MVSSLFGTAVTGKKSTPLCEAIERFPDLRHDRLSITQSWILVDALRQRDFRVLHGTNGNINDACAVMDRAGQLDSPLACGASTPGL
jgi:hypothetical protein